MNGKLVSGEQFKIAKCEDCGGDIVFINWPAGWTQSGGSKHGTEYQSKGIAWHCPRHRDAESSGKE